MCGCVCLFVVLLHSPLAFVRSSVPSFVRQRTEYKMKYFACKHFVSQQHLKRSSHHDDKMIFSVERYIFMVSRQFRAEIVYDIRSDGNQQMMDSLHESHIRRDTFNMKWSEDERRTESQTISYHVKWLRHFQRLESKRNRNPCITYGISLPTIGFRWCFPLNHDTWYDFNLWVTATRTYTETHGHVKKMPICKAFEIFTAHHMLTV